MRVAQRCHFLRWLLWDEDRDRNIPEHRLHTDTLAAALDAALATRSRQYVLLVIVSG